MSSKAYQDVYSSMTEKQRDIMHDLYMKAENHDGHAWNMYCDIEDAVAGILKEQIASAKPDVTDTYVGNMVSKEAVLDEIHKYMEERDYTIGELHDRICEIPPAQPTLYGYNIETLAAVAEIMKRNRVSPEDALWIFQNNVVRIAEMIREEVNETIRKTLEPMFAGGQDGTV